MAGTRQTNTFGEMLQKMLVDLAKMKLAPDADLNFIIDLETKVIGKLREGIDGMEQSGMSQVPGNAGLGQAIGMQGQMPPPMPMDPMQGSGVGGGVPGVMSSPQMPSGDELARILAGSSAGPQVQG